MKTSSIKKHNLNINTNIDIGVIDTKTSKTTYVSSSTKKQTLLQTNSPKFNSIINHTPSFSTVNSANGKLISLEEKFYNKDNVKGLHKINSKSGLNGNKNELEVDGKVLFTKNVNVGNSYTFSPKNTKLNNNNKNVLTNKFQPLSTRNNNKSNIIIPNQNINNELFKENKDPKDDIKDNTKDIGIQPEMYSSNNVELINVLSLLGCQNNIPLTTKNLHANIANYDSSKYSVKSMSVIKAYAANTHQGIIRYIQIFLII
jgi:hypothetical protein